MTQEEIAPHWNDILACFEKYVERFPDHETVENMIGEVVTGKRQLWIVKDETGKVILTPITEINTLPTGKRIITMCEIGGERLQDSLPMLCHIEQWAADTHGVTESQFPGRTGYRKLLGNYGYKEHTVLFTKPLEKSKDV
jgi:hypothetical protein